MEPKIAAERKPQTISDYITKILAGASAGAATGAGLSGAISGSLLSPIGLTAGGLLGGLGGYASARHSDLHTNKYKGEDWHKDNVYQVEIPLFYGLLPGAHHSGILATLTPKSFAKLSPEEKEKWIKWSKDGEEPIYFRSVSSSMEAGKPKVTYSPTTDLATARYLFEHAEPDKLSKDIKKTLDNLERGKRTVGGVTLVPPQFTNVSQIKLKNKPKSALGKYINDAMNESESMIMDDNRNYNLFTNNCHMNTVRSIAENSHFAPGTYATGGLIGAEATTGTPMQFSLWKDFKVKQD